MAKGVTATEAAVTAGFAPKRATVTGSELLARPEVKVRIAELQALVTERVTEKTGISKAWVIEELVEVVKMAKQAEPVTDAKGERTGEYKQNLPAANQALGLIGKELGMFIDRSEVRAGPLDGLEHEELRQLHDAIRALSPNREPVAESAGSTRH